MYLHLLQIRSLLSIVQMNCPTEIIIGLFDYGVRELYLYCYATSTNRLMLYGGGLAYVRISGTVIYNDVKTKYSSSYLHQLCKCMWWSYSNEHVYETRATTILECNEMLSLFNLFGRYSTGNSNEIKLCFLNGMRANMKGIWINFKNKCSRYKKSGIKLYHPHHNRLVIFCYRLRNHSQPKMYNKLEIIYSNVGWWHNLYDMLN